MERTLSVVVGDSLFDPDGSDRVAQYRKNSQGQTLYRVFLYLDGPDLPFVTGVIYRLHETFSPPTRRVIRTVANPRCKVQIWTWGVFTVEAIVDDKRGGQHRSSHRLEYAEQIEEPGIQFKAG